MNTRNSTAKFRLQTKNHTNNLQDSHFTTIFKGLKFARTTYKIQLNTKVRFTGNNNHASEWFHKLTRKIKTGISNKKNGAFDYFTYEFNEGFTNSEGGILHSKHGSDIQLSSKTNQSIPLFI